MTSPNDIFLAANSVMKHHRSSAKSRTLSRSKDLQALDDIDGAAIW